MDALDKGNSLRIQAVGSALGVERSAASSGSEVRAVPLWALGRRPRTPIGVGSPLPCRLG